MLQLDHKETQDRHMGKKNLVDGNYDFYSRSGDDYNGDFSGNLGITIILVSEVAINDNPTSGDSGIHTESGFVDLWACTFPFEWSSP